MNKKVLRILGSENYNYAKVYITIVNDKIYHSTTLNDNVTVNVLIEVTDKYIQYLKETDTLDEVIELLDIIRPRFKGVDYDENWNKLLNVNHYVKKAIKVCDITGEDQMNVGGIKGLTISIY